MDNINDKLDKYEDESLNKVVKDNIDSVDELNKQFNEYMDQSFKKRRNADDLSIQLTGLTNQQRYENQLNDLHESAIEISQDKINMAKEWSIESNISIMYPTEDIDELYNKFMCQHKDLRRRANWKCIELFGVDNHQLYSLLKNKEVKYPNIDSVDNIRDLSKCIDSLNNVKPATFSEAVELKNTENKILKKIKKLSNQDKFKWEFMYAPYLHPGEIFELEGFYSDEVEDSCNEIFKEYVDYCFGYNNNFNITKWDNEVRRLNYKLEYSMYNKQDANVIKQSLVKIGWNPEIKYTTENKLKAKKRLENIFNETYKNVSVLNMQSQFNEFTPSEVVQESKNEKLYPISIVLVRGNSKFSDLITKVTNGPFSHSAICIDSDFERLYSFNGSHYSNVDGGFSLESIDTYPRENRVGVFTFFAKQEQYDKMNNAIQNLLLFMNKTKYSIANILSIPFSNININRDEKLICSQFVDKLLKLGDIDITNKDSSKVTPNYLYNISIKNSKIYKIYDGPVKDFDYTKAGKFLDKLSMNPKPITESTDIFTEFTKTQYEYAVISEARKLPFEIKNNGDVLLTNPLINYDLEYSNSHKLLLQYHKVSNTEAMKYELARLYFMNYKLEKRIYSNKYKKDRDSNINTRARILNDFNKYINFVLEKEPNFNFAKYYEQSQFYANTVEIKSSTLKSIKNILGYIL